MSSPSNNQTYAVPYVLINGSIQFENVSMTLQQTSGSNPVKSLAGGYRGESPGSPMNEITLECNIPANGFETQIAGPLDRTIGGSALGQPGLTPVQFDVQMAGKNNTFTGQIYDITTTGNEGAVSKITYKARGSFAVFS